MRLTAKAALAALAVLGTTIAGTGCGGGDGDPDETLAGATAPAGAEGELPADRVVQIGQTIWHSGFEVELTGATLSAEEDELTGAVSHQLSVAAHFTNLGDGQSFFDPAVAVVAGGQSYPAGFDSDLPNVPSGLSAEGTLRFEVAEGFALDPAYLQVGDADQVQARVPIGPGGGELVDLAPSEPAVTASISLDPLDIEVTGAELRADIPASHRPLAAGGRALTLHFTATSRKSGNWSVQPSDFALTLPDGNSVGVDGAELGSLPGNASGVDTPDRWVRFLVADPPAGEYTLRLAPGSYWFDGDPQEGAATFTLP